MENHCVTVAFSLRKSKVNKGCFAGLAYIDIKTLEPKHFEKDEEGRIWIKKRRVKTGVLSRIPLLPMAKMILEKYKGGDRLIPIQDPSDINKYLKDIAIYYHIDKHLTFHTSSHNKIFYLLNINELRIIKNVTANDLETSYILFLSQLCNIQRTLLFVCKDTISF